MSEVRLISYHYFFRTLILLGFSSYIVILTKTDALQYYIAPRMMIYVKTASVILYIIACFQGYMALRAYWGKPVACECEQPVSRSTLRNTVAYGLLVLPLLIGFLLPNTALSSAMVVAKGMNLSAAKSSIAKQNTDLITDNGSSTGVNASNQGTAPSTVPPVNSSPAPASSTETPTIANSDAELQKMFHVDNEWDEDFSKIGMILYKKDTIVVKPEIYMEILSSIDLFKNNFIGKKIELTGFVYREDNMSKSQFVVGRFAVSCCSADATPYGVMIDFPTAQSYPKDTWVKVTGTIQNGSYNGNDIFIIKATQIEKTPTPDSPYIYPNFEPLKELN
ncbi:TIGR03943 family protein [Paenibacillus sp. V4I5]|uniref:TIGR03943 family putative permease subunit n=1 Tax=Paenibacillus sp. V4I5 TaxID=3042306 RepID=UPI00278E7AC8|nr:TIGR03943 family protein [Paenibacillus sp. V4I5]MDQ0914172.1 putative membrane protein [Paenibacillus sp. V4I5]